MLSVCILSARVIRLLGFSFGLPSGVDVRKHEKPLRELMLWLFQTFQKGTRDEAFFPLRCIGRARPPHALIIKFIYAKNTEDLF